MPRDFFLIDGNCCHANCRLNLRYFAVCTMQAKLCKLQEVDVRLFLLCSVSSVVDIIVSNDFLTLLTKQVRTNMCPVLNGYGVTTTSNLGQKLWITEKIWNTIINTLYDKFNA
jgi:hypothetical protein